MKKTLLAITSFLLCLLVLIPADTQAVLLEKTFDFEILNHEMLPGYDNTGTVKRVLVDLGQDIYQELETFFDWDAETNNQNEPFQVTFKKGALTYFGSVSYFTHLTWNTRVFRLNIEYLPGQNTNIYIFPDEMTITSSFNPDITVPVNKAYVYTSSISNFNDIVGGYEIVALLEGEVDTEDGIDVSNDFTLLPSTTGTLKDAANTSEVGYVYFIHFEDNLFETYITLAGQLYNLGTIELPGVTELNKMPLSPGIYWTEDNQRNIYYEFQEPESVKPLSEQYNTFLDDPSQVESFRPFVTMNLTTSTYTFTDKLLLYAGFYGGQSGEAYADVVFPFELEQLLSISIDYSYRWQTMWGWPVVGGYSAWNDVSVTRYLDEVVDMRTTWQNITAYLFTGVIGGAYTQLTGWNETIEQIFASATYKQDYTAHINSVRQSQGKTALTSAEIFPTGSDVYRIYLDTFNEAGYTGYEINDDIIIMDVMYQVDGEIYHVPYTDIEQGGSFGGGGSGIGGQDEVKWDFSWLTSLFENIPSHFILIGLVAIGIFFWKPIKRTLGNIQSIIKNPKDLFLFLIIIAAAMYFLGFL